MKNFYIYLTIKNLSGFFFFFFVVLFFVVVGFFSSFFSVKL